MIDFNRRDMITGDTPARPLHAQPGGPRNRGAGTPRSVRLVVDFGGLGESKGLSPNARLTRGTLLKQAAYPLVGRSGVWRAVLDIAPVGSQSIGVQLALMRGDALVSEMLHYPLVP